MKLKNIIIIFSAALTLAGCSEDFLDRAPSDALSPTTFWNTEKDADLALTGCYHKLYSPYRPEEMWSWDATTDNAFCYHENKDYRAIGNGTMAAFGVSVHSYFYYSEIRACNEYLKMENTINFSSEEKRQQYRAEVRMIRAMELFFRVHCYGDFPFSEDVFATPEESKVKRQPKDELLAFVASEFADLIPALPLEAQSGRITRDAARTFAARVALYMGDNAKARDYTAAVIQSGKYHMPELTYEQSFLKANQYNSEVMLSFEHNKAGGFGMWVGEFFPNSKYGGWSTLVPTKSLLDAYETINGKTIDEDPSYDPSNPFTNRDPRLRATILYPGQCWDKYKDDPTGYASIIPGSGDYYADANNASHTGMNFKKFYGDPNEFADIWSCDRNFPIVRYAETLLSYAEAKIELNDIDESVYDAIDQVRHRAGLPNVDRTVYSNQSKLRELVRRERRVEFAYEGLRRLDLVRWGIIGDILDGQKIQAMDGEILTTRNAEGDFNVKLTDSNTWPVIETRKFVKGKNEVLPVPQNAIDINPNLTQNPNY